MEILFIGFPEGVKSTLKVPQEFQVEWRDFSPFFLRRLYDYDVLVLNPSSDVSHFFHSKSEELKEFLKGGGVIISFCKFLHVGWFNYLFPLSDDEKIAFSILVTIQKMLPQEAIKSITSPLNSIKAGAKSIFVTPKAGILSRVLNEMDWYEYYFSNYPPGSVIIAEDKVKHPIALRMPCFGGEIILLPGKTNFTWTGDEEKYLSHILAPLLEIIPQLKKIPERIEQLPEWIKSYSFPDEDKLIEQKQEIQSRLEKIRLRKYLLAAKGRPLEDAVDLALKDIGFTVERQPNGAYIDFILKRGDVEVGAVEATSSLGSIDVKEFRQLLHFLTEYEVEKKEIKGILIGNHFCDKNPKERGDAFTAAAIKAAEKRGASLIKTTDIFDALQMLDRKEISKEEIQKKILESVGICKLIK